MKLVHLTQEFERMCRIEPRIREIAGQEETDHEMRWVRRSVGDIDYEIFNVLADKMLDYDGIYLGGFHNYGTEYILFDRGKCYINLCGPSWSKITHYTIEWPPPLPAHWITRVPVAEPSPSEPSTPPHEPDEPSPELEPDEPSPEPEPSEPSEAEAPPLAPEQMEMDESDLSFLEDRPSTPNSEDWEVACHRELAAVNACSYNYHWSKNMLPATASLRLSTSTLSE